MTSLQTTVRIGITNGEWKRQNHVRVPGARCNLSSVRV